MAEGEDNTTRGLRPRKYQEEIFERAQAENVIAALDTGSGKTFIGLLLIKWISGLESTRDKLIVFLVPRVTLVEQQAEFLSDNTPLRVLKLYGALDIELSDRIRWKRRLERCDVIVMTPQILINLLTHSLWNLERVSLLVFDECHHTRKNHPYNIIMREYFQIKPVERRPKIFGMTASPIWNMKDPTGSLFSLETGMDSKIIGVRKHVTELASHAPKPVEVVRQYPLPPERYHFHDPSLFQCLSIISPKTWDRIDVPWHNLEMRYYSTLSNLGPYCASLYLFLEIRHALGRVQSEHHDLDANIETEAVMELVPTLETSNKALPEELSLLQDILSNFEIFFWDSQRPNIVPIPVPTSWCSPKANVLKDILLECYTPTFQAIIFVEQRQVAACLAKVLPTMPDLKDKIRSAHLVGQGVNSEGISKTTDAYEGDAVRLFRSGEVNILVATSVAEEGLDFPACDLVIRFDLFQHMVGYVQSRGRARNATSRFVVMVREDDRANLARYHTWQEQEPAMNKAYQSRHQFQSIGTSAPDSDAVDDDDDDDELDASDLAGRERYVVPSSGAILTHDNAIGLLNHLCALIPRDAFTPVHKPMFTGDFQCTLKLPLSIPLSPVQLVYIGPPKHSKREAKRAVAFIAVKRLHELDVYDEYLLPTPGKNLGEESLSQAQFTLEPQYPSVIINANVKYPWTIGERLWLHPLYIRGDPIGGLIAGTTLPFTEIRSDILLRVGRPQPLLLDEEEDEMQREAMHEYTRLGIFYRITGSPLASRLGVFLVPLTEDFEVDFDAIGRVVSNPSGIKDWNGIGEEHYGKVLTLNKHEFGRTRIMQRIRNDLSPLSIPPTGSLEAAFATYHEYWMDRWSRSLPQFELPKDGPLLEAPRMVKKATSRYSLNPEHRVPCVFPDETIAHMLPMSSCGWIDMSPRMYRAFELLPVFCHKITDAYRAQCARLHLGLPFISDDLLIEALTLPSVGADFSNQRLETLGDAVLDICTTVHLMIKYPRRHEGQLTHLRQSVVSNRFLVLRAREVGLEMFISSELGSATKWPYVEPDNHMKDFRERRSVVRQLPRRGLQDCVEALLGASFIAGGIPMALRTGVALGLAFGGLEPWGSRDQQKKEGGQVSALVSSLQDAVGYVFENPDLLLEAVTHPSFEFSTTPSYQRLEFLGDSVIKMVVTCYLFRKFPEATSHQLALPRTKAICAPALASLGVRKLNIHKYLLHNNVDLNRAISLHLPILKAVTAEEIVRRGWRYDPPKALSDGFESVVGAIFVDSGYDLDRTTGIVEYLMNDVLEALSPSIPKDPVSEVLEWLGSVGCHSGKYMKFRKSAAVKGDVHTEAVSAVLHETVVAGPILSNSATVARFVAAERALVALRDSDSGELLSRVCDCKQRMNIDEEERDLGKNQDSDDGFEVEEGVEVAEINAESMDVE